MPKFFKKNCVGKHFFCGNTKNVRKIIIQEKTNRIISHKYSIIGEVFAEKF